MFAIAMAALRALFHDAAAFINLPAAFLLPPRNTPPHATLDATSDSLPDPESPATMARAKSSKANSSVDDAPRRQMVHVKTKEECRLANETIDIWSIELPSKHAESILKCVHLPVILSSRLVVRR